MDSSPRHLQLHKGEANDRSTPTAHQLDFSQANHRHPLGRQRALMAAVEADPRYQARHQSLMWWLTTYAGDDGVAQVSLAQLARDRGRDPAWVRRDVRQLAAGGHVVSRPSAVLRNRREYLIPAMVAPIRGV
ncbi:MAG TPA: hypothetical protein VFU25_04140 [Ornithinibacter sp.]|nr:hypothetical protein [Ornithinibacter sp.]